MRESARLGSLRSQRVKLTVPSWYLSTCENTAAIATALKGVTDYTGLLDVEKAQFISMFMAFFSHSQNAFYHWRDGDVPQALWIGWDALLANIVMTPGATSNLSRRWLCRAVPCAGRILFTAPARGATGIEPVTPTMSSNRLCCRDSTQEFTAVNENARDDAFSQPTRI